MQLRTIVAGLLAVGISALPGIASAHGHHHHGYGFNPMVCSQLGINPGMSRALGPISMEPSGCHTRMSNGYPIPDPKCTPGAINPTVTTDVLSNPDFRTKCIRNQVTSEHEKFITYQWYGIHHPRYNRGRRQTCELDHLVPLELGGADTLDNIWPECGPADAPFWKRYFKRKDLVENYLTKQVKEGKMHLVDAQQGIAKDWTQYLSTAIRACIAGGCRE